MKGRQERGSKEEMRRREGQEEREREKQRREGLNRVQYLASCHCIHRAFPQWGRSSHGLGCHSCSCSKGCRRPCPSSICHTHSTLCSLWSLRWCTCHGLSSYSGMSLSFWKKTEKIDPEGEICQVVLRIGIKHDVLKVDESLVIKKNELWWDVHWGDETDCNYRPAQVTSIQTWTHNLLPHLFPWVPSLFHDRLKFIPNPSVTTWHIAGTFTDFRFLSPGTGSSRTFTVTGW